MYTHCSKTAIYLCPKAGPATGFRFLLAKPTGLCHLIYGYNTGSQPLFVQSFPDKHTIPNTCYVHNKIIISILSMPAVACMRVSMSTCCIHVQQPSHPMPGLTGRPWSIARLLAVQPLGCDLEENNNVTPNCNLVRGAWEIWFG